ncbi:MAG: thiol:disulfide interchange protein DsbA/DsbL [bacterium]
MNKNKSLLIILLVGSLAWFGQAAAQQLWQEGVHYQKIEPAQPTSDKSKVEVVEVFGYLCPHCDHFQAFIRPWESKKMPSYVDYKRMPVVFRASWEPLARGYFAAEALGVADKSNAAMFNSIHREHKRYKNAQDLAVFYKQYGIDEQKFISTYKSFGVDSQVNRSKAMVKNYGVTGTPSVVVNGKWLVTGQTAGGMDKMVEVVDYLVREEAHLNKIQ